MDWHRLFGLILTDFFTGSPFVVEMERDLSVQQQCLDVLIVRKGEGEFVGQLPDGLDDLVEHNLLTFKSHHEPLDGWALHELIGHYVSYRKLVSPAPTGCCPRPTSGCMLYVPASPTTWPRKCPGNSGGPASTIAAGAPPAFGSW